MSLKTKIFLGFGSICVIFLAIGALVAWELHEIRVDTVELNHVIMPNGDHASELRYSLAFEGLLVMTYSNTGKPEDWKAATDLRAANNERAAQLKKAIDDFAGTRPELDRGFATFFDNYKAFQTVSAKLPALDAADKTSLAQARQDYADFQTALERFTRTNQDLMARHILEVVVAQQLEFEYRMILKAFDLYRLGNLFITDLLIGLNTDDEALLDETLKVVEWLEAAATELLDTTRVAENRQMM